MGKKKTKTLGKKKPLLNKSVSGVDLHHFFVHLPLHDGLLLGEGLLPGSRLPQNTQSFLVVLMVPVLLAV